MPQRTNEFQKLVYLAKHHWTEAHNVRESQMLPDRATGSLREVDVCITGEVEGHEVVVSLECTDRKRKADVTWVEQLKEKHSRLTTNVLVLYSASGFTKDAEILARDYGIETVTLERIEEGYITELMGRSGNIVIVNYHFNPTKVVAVVPAIANLKAERVVVSPDNSIFFEDGRDAPPLRELVEDLLNDDEVRREVATRGTEEHQKFIIMKLGVLDKNSNEIFLEKLEPRILRRIIALEIQGECTFELSRFPLRHATLGNIDVSWEKGELSGRDSLVVVSPNKSGQPMLTISLGEKTTDTSERQG